MATRLAVCQNTNCVSKGSPALLRDIEELCSLAGKARVEATTCLSACKKGPNVEVTKGKAEPTVINEVKTFETMEKLVMENVRGAEVSGTRRKVAKLKFQARREETDEACLEKIEEAFRHLGGSEKAQRKDPVSCGHLLVLRARRMLASQVDAALKDAEAAVKLLPTWPEGYLTMTDVLMAQGNFAESIKAVTIALDVARTAEEKKVVQKRLMHVQSQAAKAKANAARDSDKKKPEGKSAENNLAGDSVNKKPRGKSAEGNAAGDGRRKKPEDTPADGDTAAGIAGKRKPEDKSKSAENASTNDGASAEMDLRLWGEAGIVKNAVGEDSLYERLGGEQSLQTLVFGVYDMMRVDPELGPIFEKFARTPETFTRLKVRTVDYLGGQWGGPPYIGPNLFESHVSMAIDNRFYDGMMRCYRDVLKNMGAEEDVAKDAYDSVEEMRHPIVDPDGKFLRDMEQRLAKATAERQERMRKYKAQKAEEARKADEAKSQEAKAKEDAVAAPKKPKAAKKAAAPAKATVAVQDTPTYIKCAPVIVSL